MVSVMGRVEYDRCKPRPFSETFVLHHDARGWYIHTDDFRFDN